MFGKIVFCLSTFHIYKALGQGECTDVRGRQIAHGLHYVPGPDTCTLCICDNGQAKVCKAVLCSPPQDCSSFRVGNTCCEFICLDDVVKPAENPEANVRVAAGGAATILLVTVALVVYRIRKQKRRRPNHSDDQRSLTSIGYISGSMAYVGGSCETGLPGWKPPHNYMPRGEAPPPYDEAVAQSRQETMRIRISEAAFHRSYPATVESMARPDEMHCGGNHGYGNIPRPLAQMPNPQNCYNAPLLQPVLPPEGREPPNSMPHHLFQPNVAVAFPSSIRLTGSLGAISNRGLLSLLHREPPPDHERPHNVPGFYNNANATAMQSSLHRTIPRISTAIDTTILDTSISGFNRTDRSLQNEIRRSFHKPNENNRNHGFTDTGRSMPRNLNLASNTELSRSSNIEPLQNEIQTSNVRLASNNPGRSRAHSEDQTVSESKPAVKQVTNVSKMAAPPAETPIPAPQSTLPLTVDKPSCVCSYEGEETAEQGTEDADDYRSECENCKSVGSSRWVLEEGWVEEASDGTQTLQRRVPPPAPPPPATATLPQPVTKQSRTVMGPPSNWENWFNTIPDSDTESEEE